MEAESNHQSAVPASLKAGMGFWQIGELHRRQGSKALGRMAKRQGPSWQLGAVDVPGGHCPWRQGLDGGLGLLLEAQGVRVGGRAERDAWLCVVFDLVKGRTGCLDLIRGTGSSWPVVVGIWRHLQEMSGENNQGDS